MTIRLQKTAERVAQDRRAAYPDVGDQLDAVFKLALALREAGIPLPPETLAWLDTVAAIKRAHPKPV